jgi:hypothetical protein
MTLLLYYMIFFLKDEVLQHMDKTYMDVVLQCMDWPKLRWVVVFNCDTTTYFLGRSVTILVGRTIRPLLGLNVTWSKRFWVVKF